MTTDRRRVPASVLALLANTSLFALPIFADGVIAAHRDRQSDLTEASQAILAQAEGETRDLTEQELGQVTANTAEFERIERQVAARESVIANGAALSTPRGRRTEPDALLDAETRPTASAAPAQPRVEPRPRATAGGNAGFRSLGDFALSVRNAALRGEQGTDPRLRNAAASTYGAESTGADGGFAVPPDFRSEIAVKVFGEDSLIARTDRLRSSSNSITLPTDMTAPWDSTGGIQAYWDGEANALTQSKPKLEDVTYKAHKLHCLVPVTEELLEDAPAMDSYLRKKAPEKMDFKISNALVRGNGAGMPLGILNSPALVTVAEESAQTAATINTHNISKMFARMPASSRSSAVWLINPDATSELDQLAVGNYPVYLAPGGIRDNPYGTLKGRPVIESQVCDTLGTAGDILFVDWNQYMTLTKLGNGRDENGMRLDLSMHLWFDQDLVAYKFTIRLGGQPWWSVATSPNKGSNKLSPYVALATRS